MSTSGGTSWVATLGATAVVSLALHAGGLALAARLEPRTPPPQRPVEVSFDAVEPPPPPKEEPPPPPPPEPPKEKPAPKRVAMADLPPPPKSLKPPPPPPPNEEPPPSAPPAKAVPITGLSLSSTVDSGSFSVGTGNTMYGKASEVAADPKQVKPYAAKDAAPPQRISRQPRKLGDVDIPYPPEARRAGVEGPVKLLLRIDTQGRVVSARVLSDPGAGLGEAAREAVLRMRFEPGLLDGEPVEVDYLYIYRFTLE